PWRANGLEEPLNLVECLTDARAGLAHVLLEEPVLAQFGGEALGTVALGGEPLQGTDGDGLIVVATAAGRFAWGSADAAARAAPRVGAAGDEVGAAVVPLSDGPHVAAGIGVDRAGILAADLAPPVAGVGQLDLIGSAILCGECHTPGLAPRTPG